MSITTDSAEQILLQDALELGAWLKLPWTIVRDVGPAAQTLGGLLQITLGETFVPLKTIAERARLPPGTAKEHIATLNARGWILNAGRQKRSSGWLRRTTTIAITPKTRKNIKPYGVLPLWACDDSRFTWGAKAVLSVVMSRLLSLKAAIEQQDGHGCLHLDDIPASIDEMGGAERFGFSLRKLAREIGLDHKTITRAKRTLARAGIIYIQGGQDFTGQHHTDCLVPNWEWNGRG